MPLFRVTLGKHSPHVVNAVIEIPKGSHNKYEYDEETDTIRLDRILYSAVFYPLNYGFIPCTRSKDGDHLDILVIMSEPVFPGCVLEVRPIGVLSMEDEAGVDWKIIGVSVTDPYVKEVHDMGDLEESVKKEVKNFFEIYKQLEEKEVKVHHFLSKDEAYKIINDSKERYEKEGKRECGEHDMKKDQES